MEALNSKEIEDLNEILEKYSEIMTDEEIEKSKGIIIQLEKNIIDSVISNNIINVLADILKDALSRSLTKENIEELQKLNKNSEEYD